MLKKLPKVNEIISVYAVISFMAYGWTLVAFIWKLPSWLHYLTAGEILGIYSYSLLTDFVESLIFLALTLFLCAILPARLMLDAFIMRGTIFAISLMGTIMFVLSVYTDTNTALMESVPAWLVILVSTCLWTALLELLCRKVPAAASSLLGLADRLMIFLYINLPLSFFALIVVASRNLR